jgi:hypothetical protein
MLGEFQKFAHLHFSIHCLESSRTSWSDVLSDVGVLNWRVFPGPSERQI